MWFGGQDPANFFNTNTWTVPITVYCNGEWRSSVLIKSGSQAQGMAKKNTISVLSVLIKINLSTEEHTYVIQSQIAGEW